MPVDHQFNNLVTSSSLGEKEKEQTESSNDLWFAYSYKKQKTGLSQIAFIRQSLYKSLTYSDRVCVESGEVTTDLNIYTKNKKGIGEQLYYEENSKDPALFSEQEIRKFGGPIERRGRRSFRAGTTTLLITRDVKCRVKKNNKKHLDSVKTNIDKNLDSMSTPTPIVRVNNINVTPSNENICNTQSTMVQDYEISSLPEELLHQIVFEPSFHCLSNAGTTQTSSNDLWLAYSSRSVTDQRSPKVAFIKKSVYDSLSIYDRVSVRTGQITTDLSVQTKNKQQISMRLYYEGNSQTPALFTEDEISKPGGPIEKRRYISYRSGTSSMVFTYQARSKIRSRLKARNLIDKGKSSHNDSFEQSHAQTLPNNENQSHSMDDEIFSIPENILQHMIEKPLELTDELKGSYDMKNMEEEEKVEQAEIKNSSDMDENLNADNNIHTGVTFELMSTNFDEGFSDPYWEKFIERDEEAANVGIGSAEYQNSFIFFQPAIAGLGKHRLELEESHNSKKHKTIG